jgi:hypothetical protein
LADGVEVNERECVCAAKVGRVFKRMDWRRAGEREGRESLRAWRSCEVRRKGKGAKEESNLEGRATARTKGYYGKKAEHANGLGAEDLSGPSAPQQPDGSAVLGLLRRQSTSLWGTGQRLGRWATRLDPISSIGFSVLALLGAVSWIGRPWNKCPAQRPGTDARALATVKGKAQSATRRIRQIKPRRAHGPFLREAEGGGWSQLVDCCATYIDCAGRASLILRGAAPIYQRMKSPLHRQWIDSQYKQLRSSLSAKLLLETAAALYSRFSKSQFPNMRLRDRGPFKAD